MYPGVAFEILLPLGGVLAAQFVVAFAQCVINGCSRRTRASGGGTEDRPLGRRRGGGVLQ